MKILVIVVFSLSTFYFQRPLMAQVNSKPNKMYVTWITKTDASKLKGLFYSVGDSSVLISSSFLNDDYQSNNFKIQKTNFSEIAKIRLRRRGSIGKWIGIGVLTGLTTGLIQGLIEGDDPPCTQTFVYYGSYGFPIRCNPRSGIDKALTYGVTYASIGAIVGAVIGSFKIKITINRDPENFNSNKLRVKKYSFK